MLVKIGLSFIVIAMMCLGCKGSVISFKTICKKLQDAGIEKRENIPDKDSIQVFKLIMVFTISISLGLIFLGLIWGI